MAKALANLLKIKSIITLLMSVLVFILALKGVVSGEMVIAVYTSIVGFYFGTQSEKKVSE